MAVPLTPSVPLNDAQACIFALLVFAWSGRMTPADVLSHAFDVLGSSAGLSDAQLESDLESAAVRLNAEWPASREGVPIV
jgi:hypothetical protein